MISSLPIDAIINEYDAYISAPRIVEKGFRLLDIWRTFTRVARSHLGLMTREAFAVPAIGAGLKRQFSKSGKIETKLRARIDPITTSLTMMYTNMLKRKKRILDMSQVVTGVGEYEIESNEEESSSKWRND